MSSRSSARWTSFSARSTGEYARQRTAGRTAGAFRVHPGKPGAGAGPSREISAGTAAERGTAAARSGAAPVGRLAAAGGDEPRRRPAPDAAYPRLRGRDLLHDVQSAPGRALVPAGLHDDAVLAARLRRGRRRLRAQARHRHGRNDAGRAVHAGRGRVPRRLRQRADPAGQRRFLRGPRRTRRPRRCSMRCATASRRRSAR